MVLTSLVIFLNPEIAKVLEDDFSEVFLWSIEWDTELFEYFLIEVK